MTMIAPYKTALQRLDGIIRIAIKEILHLPLSVSDGLLYCSRRDGGFGVQELEVIVVSATLKSGLRFFQADDLVMQSLTAKGGLELRLRKIANAERINWPISSAKELEAFKENSRRKILAQWADSSSQGSAADAFRNR